MAKQNLRLRLWLSGCLALVCWCPLTLGLGTGAPESVCGSMLPAHGIDQQDSESPYSLGVVKESGPNGDVVVVTIFSPPGSNFQAFFLQARNANDKNQILPGSFSLPPDTRRQTCPPGENNALTHANVNLKGNLTTVWTPPPNFDGQVVFRATVAERFDLFWLDLETTPLSIKSGPATSYTDNEVPDIDYKGCGVKKGCFGIPKDCVEKEDCKIFLSFTPASDGVVFEITSNVEKYSQPWIAVGLSDDNKMGNDSVTDCLKKVPDQIIIQQSWNYREPRLGNRVLDKPQEGLSETSGYLKNGVLYCKWKRALTTEMEGYTFNLHSSRYFLLLASGEMEDDDTKRKHQGTAGKSPENLNLTVIESLPVTSVTPTSPQTDNSYGPCGISRGCFGLPSNCIKSKNCQILLTYAREKDGVLFELSSESAGADSWIAVGLSRDNKMGEDSVTDCMNHRSGELKVQQSWNNAGYPRSNKVLGNIEQGLSEIYHDYTNGKLTCRWKRQLTTNIEGFTFNLTSEQFFLLLAAGKIKSNGDKAEHTSRLSSEGPVNLTSISIVAGKSNYLIKIHGAFMVTAWIGFVSVAILLARHYKNVWENDTLCTLKVWFACHRSLMMTAVSLIIAAFVCIFIYVDGWSQAPGPHPILGCVCTGLAVIQPIMAMFRPKPNASNRYIFNWLHWFIGNSAQIIAVVTMFYAVELSAASLTFGFYYVLIGFVAFHFSFHIIMQIHTYAMEKKVHNIIQMQDLSQKGPPEFTKDAPGSGFRRFMLGIYIVINIGLVTALVLLITLP